MSQENCVRVSEERRSATATFPAELMTIGAHISQTVLITSTWLARPEWATHLKVQALGQNVRYRIDTGQATQTVGFQLQAGADTLIPVPNSGVSFCAEVAANATIEAQWVK